MTSLAVISNAWERTYYREEERFTDEIKITDVGGTFVTIDELTPDQKVVLARFIHGVHKACAHFTWNSQHCLNAQTYKNAAALIVKLLEKNISLTY